VRQRKFADLDGIVDLEADRRSHRDIAAGRRETAAFLS
jgi:hypothetical protein